MTSKAAQTSVAVIGFTYNLNDGTNWRHIYTRDGIVNVTNLTCYFNDQNSCPLKNEVSQGRAHAYGETPSIADRGSFDQIEDVEISKNNLGYYCLKTPGTCAYRFVEYNPNDLQRTYPAFTDRVIVASTDHCFTYWQTENATQANDTSGIVDATNFKISNGSINDSITIPKQSYSIDGTTYIYRARNTPQDATKFSCGDRCLWMWAYVGDSKNATFYQCPITISKVRNTTKDNQNVPDNVAKLAASAIALQGLQAVDSSSNESIWTQFQYYPPG